MYLIPVVFFLTTVSGYNVLVYSSKYAFSHMNYLGSIADTLHEAGHNVTVLQPVINDKIKGTGCELAEVISVEPDEATEEAAIPFTDPKMFQDTWHHTTIDPRYIVRMGHVLSNAADAAMRNVLNRSDVMETLRNQKFDIAVFEMFDYGAIPIFYELNITNIIGTHSTVLTERTSYALGVPLTPSYVPGLISTAGDDGSFTSRFINCVTFLFSWEFERLLQAKTQEYLDRYYPNAPNIQELVANMPFVFTNAEPFTDFSKPTLHKVIDIGGIGLKPSKKMDEVWLETLSKRKQNVLVSFGSMAPSYLMPEEYMQTILEVATKFPDVTFIWKYEKPEDEIANNVPNVILSHWTPQGELLSSGKIDLFVTHGGAGSLMESAHAGVPLVVIPLFGDQTRNALMAERFGYGIFLDKTSLSSISTVEAAVRKGLEDQSVKEAAQKAKELINMEPLTAKELLLRHMDIAVKFPSIPSLTPSGRNFTIVKYYNLDILALILFILISVLWIVFKSFRRLFVGKKQKIE